MRAPEGLHCQKPAPKGSKVLWTATSALDHATTDQIISSIANLTDTTRIVIVHDNLEEAQLTKFDEVLMMKDGRLR